MAPPISEALDLLAAPVAQGRVTRIRAHRPWPLPRSPWLMGQTWTNLLFAHWSVAPALLQGVVPAEFALDTHDGRAWIGVTPFRVRNLRPRLTLPVPVLSKFPEINVRTYVVVGDRPGIYFFSLDADSPLAVAAARRLYRLPYFRADISVRRRGDELLYDCSRGGGKAFSAEYRPDGAVFNAEPGSLEYFLTERYCLYAEHEGDLFRADIHHRPWPLQPARARIDLNTMPPVKVSLGETLVHYSARQDVVIWPLVAA